MSFTVRKHYYWQVGNSLSLTYRKAYRMEGYPDRINVDRVLLNYVLIMLDNNVYATTALTYLL